MRRLAIVALVALAAPIFLGAGPKTIVQEHGLRVTVSGGIAPRALPRQHLAPVTARFGGKIEAVDDARPPALSQLSIEVNRVGQLSSRGLPTCSAPRLQQTTTQAALAACREALVGHGSFGASVDFPGAPAIPAEGKVLVFNARVDGRPGMLLHLYGSRPVRAAFVLPFAISRRSEGRFGSVLTTRIPNIASGLGYITRLQIQIGRRYSFRGERRSFLSASCAAPAGFPGGSFELAKMTFSFDDEREVIASLERNCRVR
jgi:hypothetical protein